MRRVYETPWQIVKSATKLLLETHSHVTQYVLEENQSLVSYLTLICLCNLSTPCSVSVVAILARCL